MNTFLQKAIDVMKGQEKLADALSDMGHTGCSQSMISYWLNKSKNGVPAEYCPAIEKITGIPKKKLRPDIYGSSNA